MLHKIIKTDNYLLMVDDVGINEDQWCLVDGKLFKYNRNIPLSECKKVIAHLPIFDSFPIKGVLLLPPLNVKDGDLDTYISFMKSANIHNGDIDIWTKGYNRAKEKYKFTEEDIRKALWELGDVLFNNNQDGIEDGESEKYFDDIIRSISQPKLPTHFEVEMETPADSFTSFVGNIVGQGTLPKTITNSQGQIQLIGKYIYEGGEK